MIWFWLISLMTTASGLLGSDIPRPFASQADCDVAGFRRAAEIAADASLRHGVWVCLSVDFDAADPIPPTAQPEPPLTSQRNG